MYYDLKPYFTYFNEAERNEFIDEIKKLLSEFN